jgi:hypothetical protein
LTAFTSARAQSPCTQKKAIYSVEENNIGVRVYKINTCTNKILDKIYQSELSLNIINQIYDGKKIIIPQSLQDLIINYFNKLIEKTKNLKINQKYILISDYVRMARNAPSLINNIEKSTKIKVYDKTSEQTVDMITLSVISNLGKESEMKTFINDEFILFNLTKRKILLKKFTKTFNKGGDYLMQQFSSITMEKFIKKDIFHWTKLSINKSVNPIGNFKVKQVIDTYIKYLRTKLPEQYITNIKQLSKSKDRGKKKYTNYSNKISIKKKERKHTTLIITGDSMLDSLKALKIRGRWLRRNHLLKKINDFASMTDGRIPAGDTRYAVINLILLYGHMIITGYEKALIQASDFEEGFLLHPSYH